MAFGQEVGRVLSDGRIVGRAEPFAKVFPSSRVVKRAVGLAAWGVLEDIALDARLDEAGRLVADTNVRRIAANLGLNKDTVTKHLRTLRGHGFVLQEEVRGDASGRYETARYVLDPSACLERFTHTPAAVPGTAAPPRPSSSDTVAGPVSEDTGHGGTGHGDLGRPPLRDVDVVEEQQQRAHAGDGELAEKLAELGVAGHVAADLLGRYPPDRVRDAAFVAAGRRLRNPAAWLVAALRHDWDLSGPLGELRAAEARRVLEARQAAEAAHRGEADARLQARRDGWTAAVSAALDDRRLALALGRVTTPIPGVGRRSVPLAQAQLVSWAVQAARARPELPLAEALERSLSGVAQPAEQPPVEEIPDPPAGPRRPDLTARIRRCLSSRSFPSDPSKEHTREPDTRSVAR
jgi:DNA-binding transcriptional ArsR family regulator